MTGDRPADEPFLQLLNGGQPFAAVPYSVHLNDIAIRVQTDEGILRTQESAGQESLVSSSAVCRVVPALSLIHI